jgi:flagellin
MRINTNIASLNAQVNAANTNKSLTSSLEKLSSGLRINKAADDASGMAIADKLRTQASSLGQGISNANSGSALIQIADKALGEQSSILDTIKTKLIQASTSTTSENGREAIRKDISKLLDQMDNISAQTTYNGINLLDNKGADFSFQVGEKSTDIIAVQTAFAVNTDGLGSVKEEVVRDTGKVSFSGAAGTTASVIDGDQNVGVIGDYALTLGKDDLSSVTVRSTAGGTGADGVGGIAINTTIQTTASTADKSFTVSGNEVSAIQLTGLDGTAAGALSVDLETTDESLKLLLDAQLNDNAQLAKTGDGRYTWTTTTAGGEVAAIIEFGTATDISNLKFSGVASGALNSVGVSTTAGHEMITIISADDVTVTKNDENDLLSISGAATAAANFEAAGLSTTDAVTATMTDEFDTVKLNSTLKLSAGSATVQVDPALNNEKSYVVIDTEAVATGEAEGTSFTIDAKKVESIELDATSTSTTVEVTLETDDEDLKAKLVTVAITNDRLSFNEEDNTFTLKATAASVSATIDFGDEAVDITNLTISGVEAHNTAALREKNYD